MTSKRLALILVSIVAGLALSCMNRDLVRVDPKTESYITEDVPVQDFVGVDVLVVVDNSGSMAAEQGNLRTAFPNLISAILNPPLDPETGKRVHAPVRDLHLGVVSVDMGVGGYPGIETCGKDDPGYDLMFGDNGVLQNTPHGAECDSGYPSFLSYMISATDEPNLADVTKISNDFGCIAVLGTDGCGFAQQLEAGYKAIMPPPEGNNGPGAPNTGFIRDNTILVVLFVSDGEDCSVQDPTLFDVAELPYSINLQCFYQESKLWAIDRYINAFRTVRPNADNLVVGFIVGVPPANAACNGLGNQLGDCLGLPEMQARPQADGDILEYACKFPSDCTPADPNTHNPGNCMSEAFPARRYVQLAQQLGEQAVVQSICQGDFNGAVSALTEKLKEAIKRQGFSRELDSEKDSTDSNGDTFPDDPCRCVTSCSLIETLSDVSPCPAGKLPYDADGDTMPDFSVDELGQSYTLCELPQAGIRVTGWRSDLASCLAPPANMCAIACDDPCATFDKDPARTGWWYDPATRTIDFLEVMPRNGSGLHIECCLP